VDVFVPDEFRVWAPILRTRLALRLAAQLADVPCVALRRTSCRRADVPCVMDVSCVCVADMRCVGATNLGEAVLKSLPPSKNLFLSIIHLVC
jgi:hypothetical protein